MYCVSGLNVESDIPFPELGSADGRGPDCSFRLVRAHRSLRTPGRWLYHWRLPNGERWLSCAKRDAQYLLRFEELADFLISRGGKRIACYALPDTPDATVRHLFLDQVIPLVLNARGIEALHASAVRTPYGAWAFIGEAGWGKSTLAASFAGSGFTPLSDDCLALAETEGDIVGVPSYPGLRLWSDAAATFCADIRPLPAVAHYTKKVRVAFPKEWCSAPVPLGRIYVLAPPIEHGGEAAIRIEPLSGRDSVMELVRYTFRLDIEDHRMLTREFLFLGTVVSRIPVRRLTYPRDLSLLPAVHSVICADLRR
ncbi:MAG: hypothetical protein HYU25_06475 [Candidatus Rokubacteria bacterium]|nr:hypothetical protein [Candidatus Rokubacteria bacterium]